MRASGALLVLLLLAACAREPVSDAVAPEATAQTAAPESLSLGPSLSAHFVGDTLSVAERRLLWQETQPLLDQLRREDSVSVQVGFPDLFLDFNEYALSASGGRVFSSTETHLYVRVHRPEGDGDDPDDMRGKMLGGVLQVRDSTSEWVQMSLDYLNTWMGDTLQHVNGDVFRDLVVSHYPSAGCCPRERSITFLYDSKTGGFAERMFFLNPVYVPEEGLVRGMEYGRHAPFYTKRFVGLTAEDVECVYRTPEAAMPYAVGSCEPDGPRKGVREVPSKYNVLNDYRDWFEGAPPR